MTSWIDDTQGEGLLTKMAVSLASSTDEGGWTQVEYGLRFLPSTRLSPTSARGDDGVQEEEVIQLSSALGGNLRIEWRAQINCVDCGGAVKKRYGDGYCGNCFFNSPMTSECIIRPELCLAHLGQGRDPEWEAANHAQPHYVYLALTNQYKVGVTRDWPTRWIDQGADEVAMIAETPYRQLAGEIETILSQSYSDKTSWQRMLKNEALSNADLMAEVERARALLPEHLRKYVSTSPLHLRLKYPRLEEVDKVKSVKLDKVGVLEGQLIGIKGQYLIFSGGHVLNVRAHSGYLARFTW